MLILIELVARSLDDRAEVVATDVGRAWHYHDLKLRGLPLAGDDRERLLQLCVNDAYVTTLARWVDMSGHERSIQAYIIR